jgi:hypothetical protein
LARNWLWNLTHQSTAAKFCVNLFHRGSEFGKLAVSNRFGDLTASKRNNYLVRSNYLGQYLTLAITKTSMPTLKSVSKFPTVVAAIQRLAGF